MAIDRDHLARQTLNDAALRDEVLELFRQQVESVSARIGAAAPEERLQLAHGLRGSAGGVGAMAVAACAADVEAAPGDMEAVVRLQGLIEAVVAEIAEIKG